MQTIQNLKSGTTNVSKFDYTYNAVGTIATWTQQADSSTAVVNTLSYDKADQLTNCTQSGGGSASNAYVYDPAGNRLAETTASGTTGGQFNKLNQLVGIGTGTSTTVAGYVSSAVTNVVVNAIPASLSGGTNFTASVPLPPSGTNDVVVVAQDSSGNTKTQRVQIINSGAPTALVYDANGNVTTDENGNNYKWDALNRLTAIIYNSGTYSGTHTEFAYDGLSRRTPIVERAGTTVGTGTVSSTKNYVWIGSQIVDERNTSNVVQKRFFPQGEQQSGTAYYYTWDHLGSVREMLNSSGTIVARYSYDPFGRSTKVSGALDCDFQYAGMYYHAASGLNLTAFRAYNPNTGTWLSRDPRGERAGLNLYAYVGDNPINYVDVLGLDRTDAQRSSQFVHGLIGIGVAALAVGVLVGTLSLTVVASPIIVGGAVIISGVTIAAAGIYGLANMAAAFSPNTPEGDRMSKVAEDLPASANELASEIITGKKDVGKTADTITTITTGEDIDKLLDAIDKVLDEIDEQLKDGGSPSGGGSGGGGCMDSSPLLTAPPMGLTPDGLRP